VGLQLLAFWLVDLRTTDISISLFEK